jgi:ferredoxin-NADP reductase
MNPSILSNLDRVLTSPLVAALTAPYGVDRFLEPFNPMWSATQVRGRIEAVQRQTRDSVTITVRPNRHWQGFVAGQYARIEVEIDGVRRSRCYSLASAAPGRDGAVEFTIKQQDGGLVSTFLYAYAQVGMVLGLSQAEGEFVLPESATPAPLLLVAGGSGITPVMSMLRTLDGRANSAPVSLLYYVRSTADTIYGDELAAMFARHADWQLQVVRTREGGSHFSPAHVDALVADLAAVDTYVCGPAALIDALIALCAERGCETRLRHERFTAPVSTVVLDPNTVSGELRFVRSERLATNDGRSLLDQAEAAGLRPEAGCRMGICHSCTCRKTSGVVRDLRSGKLSSDGEEDIQICVSAAVGDVTLDL